MNWLAPYDANPKNHQLVYPFTTDENGNVVRGDTLEDAVYFGYGVSDPTHPELGMTAYADATQGNTFATQGHFQVANAIGTIPDNLKRALLLGAPYSPKWLTRTGVYSCSEYVYKRFFGYQRYVDAALAQGENWDRAFLLAYSWSNQDPRAHDGVNVGIVNWGQLESYHDPATLTDDLEVAKHMPVETSAIKLTSIARNAFFHAPSGVWEVLNQRAQSTDSEVAARAQRLLNSRNNSDQAAALGTNLWPLSGQSSLASEEFGAHRALYDEMLHRYSDMSRAEIEDNDRRVRGFAELILLDGLLHHELACLDNPTSIGCIGVSTHGLSTQPDASLVVQHLADRMIAEQNPTPSDPALDPTDLDQFQNLDAFQVAGRVSALKTRIGVLSSPVLRSVPLQTPELEQVAASLATKMQSVGATSSVVQKGASFSTTTLTSFMTDAKIKTITLTSAQLKALTPSALINGSAEQLTAVLKLDAGTAAQLSDDVLKILPLSLVASWAQQNPIIEGRLDLSEAYKRRAALAAQITETENKMADALEVENDRGARGCWQAAPLNIICNPKDPNCTNDYRLFNPNRCDWSSKMAVQRFTTMARRFEEAEYNRCIKHTGNDFSENGPLFRPELQARKLYPSYERGSLYYPDPVYQYPVIEADVYPATGTYVIQDDTAKYLPKDDGFWIDDALRLNSFMKRIENAKTRRSIEEDMLIRDLNEQAKAGKAEMQELPLVESAVLDPNGQPADEQTVTSYYGTPVVTGLGTSKSDGDSYGDPEWFDVDWGYSWSWNVQPRLRTITKILGQNNVQIPEPLEALNPWWRFAGFEGAYQGSVFARARGLNGLFDFEAFDARVSGQVIDPLGDPAHRVTGADVTLTIQGEQIAMSTDTSVGTEFHLVSKGNKPNKYSFGPYPVPIGLGSLDFEGWVTTEAGLTHQLDAIIPVLDFGTAPNKETAFKMAAVFEPYVTMTAGGSASVGVGVASGGGEINVLLLHVGLPASVSLKSLPTDTPDPTATLTDSPNPQFTGGYRFVYSEAAAATIDSLDGSVSGFIKIGVGPFSRKFSKTFFSWDGIHQDIPIIAQRDKSFNLSSWGWQIYGSPVHYNRPNSGGQTETGRIILSMLMKDL